MEAINKKVHAGALGGGGGSVAAVLLIWVMQAAGVAEAQFTPERVVALTGACAFAGSYLGGYFKKE